MYIFYKNTLFHKKTATPFYLFYKVVKFSASSFFFLSLILMASWGLLYHVFTHYDGLAEFCGFNEIYLNTLGCDKK